MALGLRTAAALLALTALLALACGPPGGALPDPSPCPLPWQPTPPPGASPQESYLGAVEAGETLLAEPTNEFLARWPARSYSRQQRFREELAAAADAAACRASRLRSLSPPDPRYAAFDAALDSAMDAYEADMRVGREAAQSRNVTKFRAWLRAVDALPELLAGVEANRPAD